MKRVYFGVVCCLGFLASLAGAQGPPAKEALPKHALLRIGDNRFHGGGHRLRFAPDGKTLAIADDEAIRLFDPVTGTDRVVLRHLSKSTSKSTELTGQDVVEMAFFADGKSMASADFVGVLRLWNLETGKETRLPAMHPGVATLCLSADEKSFFTAGFDGILNEWQLPIGKLKQSWKAPSGEAIIALTRLADKIAGVTRDGTLFHWDPATGKDTKRVELGPVLFGNKFSDFGAREFPMKGSVSPTFAVRPHNVEFSPDGKRLAQIQGRQIWDVESGKVIASLTLSKTPVRFAFSYDNKSVVMAPTGFKESIQLAEVATGTEKAKLDVARVDAVAFSPDGHTIAFAAERRIRLWHHAKNHVAGGEGAIGTIRDWDIAPDGKEIAISTGEKLLRLYDLTTGKHKESFDTEGRAADIVRYHPDGKSLIAGLSDVGILHFEKKGDAWQVSQRFPVKEQLHKIRGHGPYALIGNQFQRLFDIHTGKAPPGLGGFSNYSHGAYSPNGRYLLLAADVPLKKGAPMSGGRLKEYQLFQVPQMTLIRSIKPPPRGFAGFRFSPDGRTLLFDAQPLKIIELLTGAERMTVPIAFINRSLQFAPDGSSILGGTFDGGVVVVGLAKRQELYRASRAHTAPVQGLEILNDGKVLSISLDESLLVWSPELWKGQSSVTPLKLDPEDLDLLYQNLGKREGPDIGSSMASLSAGGDATAQFLKAKLKPAAGEDQIAPKSEPLASRIRDHRAIEILERIGTPAAIQALETLARGHERAASTVEAKESIARLKK